MGRWLLFPSWLMGAHFHLSRQGLPASEAGFHTSLTEIQHNSPLLVRLLCWVLSQILSYHTLFPISQEKVPPVSKLSQQWALLLRRTKSLKLCRRISEIECTISDEQGLLIAGELKDLALGPLPFSIHIQYLVLGWSLRYCLYANFQIYIFRTQPFC